MIRSAKEFVVWIYGCIPHRWREIERAAWMATAPSILFSLLLFGDSIRMSNRSMSSNNPPTMLQSLSSCSWAILHLRNNSWWTYLSLACKLVPFMFQLYRINKFSCAGQLRCPQPLRFICIPCDGRSSSSRKLLFKILWSRPFTLLSKPWRITPRPKTSHFSP